VISGGLNVYAIEVEEIILSHPEIAQAAVIGIPDNYWGETVHAMIVLFDSINKTIDDKRRIEQEVRQICKRKLADYKQPKSYEFQNDLPKTPTGKVSKQVLRNSYGQS